MPSQSIKGESTLHHINAVIQHKETEIAYAKTALLQALDKGTRAEQLHSLDRLNELRIELKAYRRLLHLIHAENEA
jgi:CHAD domain-containing protein